MKEFKNEKEKILDVLEEVTDIGEWNYGLDNIKYLLKIGFTIDEMNEFITKKWNEFHQLKEEEENE